MNHLTVKTRKKITKKIYIIANITKTAEMFSQIAEKNFGEIGISRAKNVHII